jgi:hypothetical protein
MGLMMNAPDMPRRTPFVLTCQVRLPEQSKSWMRYFLSSGEDWKSRHVPSLGAGGGASHESQIYMLT